MAMSIGFNASVTSSTRLSTRGIRFVGPEYAGKGTATESAEKVNGVFLFSPKGSH